MDSDTKEFGHVRVADRRTLGIPRIESDHTFLETVLPIENLLLARVLIRVRNRPLQERHRTGRSREQMSLWLAGYPKTPGFDVRFGSKADVTLLNFDVRYSTESGHRLSTLGCPLRPTTDIQAPHSPKEKILTGI
jgi:hypothetical protein